MAGSRMRKNPRGNQLHIYTSAKRVLFRSHRSAANEMRAFSIAGRERIVSDPLRNTRNTHLRAVELPTWHDSSQSYQDVAFVRRAGDRVQAVGNNEAKKPLIMRTARI